MIQRGPFDPKHEEYKLKEKDKENPLYKKALAMMPFFQSFTLIEAPDAVALRGPAINHNNHSALFH